VKNSLNTDILQRGRALVLALFCTTASPAERWQLPWHMLQAYIPLAKENVLGWGYGASILPLFLMDNRDETDLA